MKHLQGKLTYANVVATIALFIALGGSAYAATQLKKNSVGTKQIKNNAITAAKVKDGAITGSKIQLSSLGTVPSATTATQATSADAAKVANHASSADTATVATTANALREPEAPHFVGQPGEPTFEAGVVNFGAKGRVRFWKDRQCEVHLAGSLKGDIEATGTVVFTLPTADFPEEREVYAPIAGGLKKLATLEVLGEGEVKLFSEATGVTSFGFDGVNFRAATC